MIDKSRLGIALLDDQLGGIYRKRPTLCCGPRGSGKTLLALHCLRQAVRDGEHGLLLSQWRSDDLAIVAEQYLGFECLQAAAKGRITLLEYDGIMSAPERDQDSTLPPDSYTEFIQIVESRSVSRVILDTVLPWVAIRQRERLTKHVYSFVQALDRLGVTSLLTLPRPVSPLAFTLKNVLEDLVPISLALDMEPDGTRNFSVVKYLGENRLPHPQAFTIRKGSGITTENTGPPHTRTGESPPSSDNLPPPTNTSGNIRFASAFKHTTGGA